MAESQTSRRETYEAALRKAGSPLVVQFNGIVLGQKPIKNGDKKS